jgi:hypothetical protein
VVIGMFSRNQWQSEQEAAQMGTLALGRLARRDACSNVDGVVETRDERVKTICLYRYPSPVGRRSHVSACPPVFFGASRANPHSFRRTLPAQGRPAACQPNQTQIPAAVRRRIGDFTAIAPWTQTGPRPEGTLNVQ